jgi:hypothetical protein
MSPTLDIPIRPYTAPVRFEPQSGPVRRTQRSSPSLSADWRSEVGEPPRVVPTPPDQITGDAGTRRPGPMPPAQPILVIQAHSRLFLISFIIHSRLCMMNLQGQPQPLTWAEMILDPRRPAATSWYRPRQQADRPEQRPEYRVGQFLPGIPIHLFLKS